MPRKAREPKSNPGGSDATRAELEAVAAAELEKTYAEFVSSLANEQPRILTFAMFQIMLRLLQQAQEELRRGRGRDDRWPVLQVAVEFGIDVDWETERIRHVRFDSTDLAALAQSKTAATQKKMLAGVASHFSQELFFQATAGSAWFIKDGMWRAGCLDDDLRKEIEEIVRKLPRRKREVAYDEIMSPVCFGFEGMSAGGVIETCRDFEMKDPDSGDDVSSSIIVRHFSLPCRRGEHERLSINFSLIVEPAVINRDAKDAYYSTTLAIWLTRLDQDGQRDPDDDGLVDVGSWPRAEQDQLLTTLRRALKKLAASTWRVVVQTTVETTAADAKVVQRRFEQIASTQERAFKEAGIPTRITVRQKCATRRRSDQRRPQGPASRHPLEALVEVDRDSLRQGHRALAALFDSPTWSLTTTQLRELKLTSAKIATVIVRSVRKSIEKEFPTASDWLAQENARRGEEGRLFLRREPRTVPSDRN